MNPTDALSELETKTKLWYASILPRLVFKENGCVEWPGAKGNWGYGVVCWEGTTYRVHRVALEVTKGELLGDLFACHRCDNPICANPAHLFAGTNKDNIDDAVSKGRSTFGLKGTRAFHFTGRKQGQKVMPSHVAEITKLFEQGIKKRAIARKVGFGETTIRRVLKQAGAMLKTTEHTCHTLKHSGSQSGLSLYQSVRFAGFARSRIFW